jgi:aconitase A
MGLLSLEFEGGTNRKRQKVEGNELFDITRIEADITPGIDGDWRISHANGSTEDITIIRGIDTLDELEHYRHDEILEYVLRDLATA